MMTMKTKHLVLGVLLLVTPFCFGQQHKKSIAEPSSSAHETLATEPKAEVLKTASNPENPNRKAKVGPEVFYVVDDKPVDYKTYLLHLQKNKKATP